MNVIVSDPIAAALENDHADRRRKHPSQFVQMIVTDDMVEIQVKRFTARARFTHPDAARADVVHLIFHDAPALTTPAQFQRIPAQVREFAPLNRAIDRAFAHQITSHIDGCLPVQITVAGQRPVNMGKCQPAQDNVLHWLPRREITVEP